MKLILGVLFILPVLHTSQTYRITYDLQFKKDSLNTDRENIRMILDIDKQYVKFYDEEFLEVDSLRKYTNDDISVNSASNLLVKRKINSDENINFKTISFDYYIFISNDILHWKLLPDKKNYNSYTLQKATTEFGGRIWTAWFDSSTIIPEGPYKFRGLPGLIFEVYDHKDSYHFSLKKIKQIKEYDTTDFLETNYGKKPIKVSITKYNELLLSYYNDPYWWTKRSSKWKISFGDGKTYSDPKDLPMLIRQKQKEILNNNNLLEINHAPKYK